MPVRRLWAESGGRRRKEGIRGGPFPFANHSRAQTTVGNFALHAECAASRTLAAEYAGSRTLAAQKAASSSSMTSLSRVSTTWRVLVNNGRKFFAKNDATAILPS